MASFSLYLPAAQHIAFTRRHGIVSPTANRGCLSGEFAMMKPLFGRAKGGFHARSSERDSSSDDEAVLSVAAALDLAVQKAEAERAGLKGRIDDVISRAAIVGGNEIDDWQTRTDDRSRMLSESDAEIRRGQARLKILEQNISHFKFLKTALQTRFPDSVQAPRTSS
jgi:hypothetical protein